MAQIRQNARIALGLTAAGVAGTAFLFGPAAPAQASSVNWNAIAKCESGGNWSINTGNGYYGGLQFSRSTWKAYGGTKYASTANKASKSEQIKIAEKVLDGQGIGAWPTCGKKGGSVSASSTKKSTATKSTEKKKSTATKKSTEKVTAKKPAAKATIKKPTTKSSAKATGANYVVKSGDTLARIATAEHVTGGWRALYQLNQGTISNPNLIFPGQRLSL